MRGDPMYVQNYIRCLRRHGWSFYKIAKAVDVNHSMLSRTVKGTRLADLPPPVVDKLAALAKEASR